MTYHTLQIEHGGGMLATVWLNRPGQYNVLDSRMLDELIAVFAELGAIAQLRAIVLAARGPQFCLGIDPDWRQQLLANAADRCGAEARLAALLQAIHACAVPVVAKVQGDCHGAGTGLVAACDIALAAGHAGFRLPELQPDMQPDVAPVAHIPWVAQAMGARATRRYLLTAERFSAFEAKQFGLVHEAVAADALDERADAIVAALLQADRKKVFGDVIWNKVNKPTGSPAA
ncbi:enoyl-CoA hydratase-related protein [Noviherbaspirillum sedimenti]|nr:enoyl-CoA hydratase-related protein [Noviherbaspirillum sedimenti]